jgi:mannose-6-phosphate isomerase-like protein (cupin superfamily)
LQGVGELRVTGNAPLAVRAPGAVYVPPGTEHHIANTGTEALIYVYVAAPTTLIR